MTTLDTATPKQLAAVIYGNYHFGEVFSVYTDSIPDDYDSLDDLICADIRDLLHNGNIEDLFGGIHLDNMGSQDDVDAFADKLHNDYELLGEISLHIAALMTDAPATQPTIDEI